MKKLLLQLSIVFMALTFAGAWHVLSTQGQANAGYALIPMVFALVFIQLYRKKDREDR